MKHVNCLGALALGALLTACGGGSSGSPGGTTPIVDTKPDALVFDKTTFDNVMPGKTLTAIATLSGFDGELTAQAVFDDAHKGAPVLIVNSDTAGGKPVQKVKAGDKLKLQMVVGPSSIAGAGPDHEIAAGDRMIAMVTLGEGDDAVSAKITAQVGDLEAPTLSVDFPPDRTVTSAETVSVSGRVWDDVAIASVSVNGEPAFVNQEAGEWSLAAAALSAIGGNDLVVEIRDAAGKVAKKTVNVFRYDPDDATTWATAEEQGYFGDVGDLPGSISSSKAVVDTATGKMYVQTESVNGYELIEFDPDTGDARRVLTGLPLDSSRLLNASHPLLVHEGIAYFYVLDGHVPSGEPGQPDDYDGIYSAVLAECSGEDGNQDCVQAFALNGVGGTDQGELLFYDLDAHLFLHDDELWVFNYADSPVDNGGLFVRLSLDDGTMPGTPKAVDAADERSISLTGGTLVHFRNLGHVLAYDLAADVPDDTETILSTCSQFSPFSASLNCAESFDDAIGKGPNIYSYRDIAEHATNGMFFVSADALVPDGSGGTAIRAGLYSIDMSTGDRVFLIGEDPATGNDVFRGEFPAINNSRLISDMSRRRVYFWAGDALYAVNLAEVKDAETGEMRIAMDSVIVSMEP